MTMTEGEVKQQLEGEGYTNVSAWLDSPDFSYSEHTHTTTTVHVLLAGSMTLTMGGRVHELRPGDRIEVPAGMAHTAVMGPEGCTYVTGEK